MTEQHCSTASPSGTFVELRLLQAELTELQAVIVDGQLHDILDAVADVLCRARCVAGEAGITVGALDEYVHYKSKIRALIGRDELLERHVARGVLQSRQ